MTKGKYMTAEEAMSAVETGDRVFIHGSAATPVPDAHGYCSLGTSVDIARAAVDTAHHVIALVNPRMPRTHGDSFVHTRS